MTKFYDFSDPENEKYFKIGFKKNYGIWLMYGGMFLGSPLIPAAFVIAGVALISCMAGTVIKLGKTDLVQTIESLHFIIFISTELLAIAVFLQKRALIKCVFTPPVKLRGSTTILPSPDTRPSAFLMAYFKIIGKGFFDYGNTLDAECLELRRAAYSKTNSKKRLIHHAYVTVVMSACIMMTVLRPLLLILLPSEKTGTPDDGIVRFAMIPIWTPFDKSHWYATVFVWLIEYIVSWITPGIVFGGTFLILFTLEELETQLQILNKSLCNVIQRAERLDMELEESIKLCFKYSIRHHQLLFEFKDILNETISVPGFGLFFSFTIMLCMSGFIFTLNEVAIVPKLVFGLFLLSELVMLFFLCFFGERLIVLSDGIGEALYKSNWANHSKLMKHYMLIIQMRSRQAMKINLMGFMSMSKETFSNISSTSYSYLNLIREFN